MLFGTSRATQFGKVMHYGSQISPPANIKWICLASIGLFSANITSVLANAFSHLNSPTIGSSQSSNIFVGLLIGGVYLPTPVSLWLTRMVTRRLNHIAGLLLF